MNLINFEFKAAVDNLEIKEQMLLKLNPVFKGEDHQVDTYFNVQQGRLKLREGNIENALIYYERANTADAKQSSIILYKHTPDKALKDILTRLHGIKAIVDKRRRIYFIDNVKFHFDEVKALGTFMEVEAIDTDGSISTEKLKQQCDEYFAFFGLTKDALINYSYSDLIMDTGK